MCNITFYPPKYSWNCPNTDETAKVQLTITKTYLYNFHPLKPLFYIVKLGFTGVYIIFLISAQKHIEQKCGKNIRIFIWKLSVFDGEIFNIFE